MFWGAALARPRAGSIVAVVGCLLALAGCSTQTKSAVTVSGSKLTIYASQPPVGAGGQVATDVLEAEKLALIKAGGRAGKYTIAFRQLDGRELSDNPRTALQNSTAIAYLGEIVPGTSQISVPINNELGLLQVSPTDTAAYLTQATPQVSGSPGTFYPTSSTYHQTFARVVPTTVQEAQAIVSEMRSLHLSKLYIGSDGSDYGASIAAEVRQDSAGHGLTVQSSPTGADAVFYGGNVVTTAARAVGRAASAAPSAKLFVPSALYDTAFVSALSPAAQNNLYVSSPGFSTQTLTAAGRQFVAAFRLAYGHQPQPQAIFGFEAMSALLSVLSQAGAAAASRAVVVSDFRSLHNRQSVLGTYSIQNGDTTIAPFIFARARAGALVPVSH